MSESHARELRNDARLDPQRLQVPLHLDHLRRVLAARHMVRSHVGPPVLALPCQQQLIRG